MSTYPTSPRSAFLEWCQAHITIFEAKWQDIGITQAQAADFKAATEAAAAKLTALNMAKTAAMGATEAAGTAFGELRTVAAAVVRSIRTFAENENNPNVYVLANVPPPVDPSVAPPPAKPTNISVELNGTTGAVMLSWKASNPAGTSGTSYIIRRRTNTTGEFAFVGVTGEKRFTDNTFFAGPDMVQYTIQGQRADSAGQVSDIFTINFGRAGGGLSIESASEGAKSVKLAA